VCVCVCVCVGGERDRGTRVDILQAYMHYCTNPTINQREQEWIYFRLLSREKVWVYYSASPCLPCVT
jgi:hypothetical protein